MITLTDKMAFKLPDFMASTESKRDSQRPRPLHVSKSFSKLEPASPDRSTRVQRASTIQNGVNTEGAMSDKLHQAQRSPRRRTDAFEKSSEDEEDQGQTGEVSEKLPADFDELPIELISLTDRLVRKSPNVLQILIRHSASSTPYLPKSILPHQQSTSCLHYFKTSMQLLPHISIHIFQHCPLASIEKAHRHPRYPHSQLQRVK